MGRELYQLPFPFIARHYTSIDIADRITWQRGNNIVDVLDTFAEIGYAITKHGWMTLCTYIVAQ